MLFTTLLPVTLLALGVSAAPAATADPAKAFKFSIEDPKKGTWYLADAKGAGTQDAAKALVCSMDGEIMKCGGKGFQDYPQPNRGDMLKLATTGNSKGWGIDEATGKITWKAKPAVNFDVGYGGATDMWAETCPDAHGHFTGARGSAKAVWIETTPVPPTPTGV